MEKSFWNERGNWYKGNLHAHTDQSDGSQSVEQAIDAYKAAGYDFLSITDHNLRTRTKAFSTKDFLLIPGEEITAGTSFLLGGELHILGINISEGIAQPTRQSPQQVIDKIRALGGEAIVAHPYWSGMTMEELAALEGYLGIEVFNSSCHYSIGKGDSAILWDSLLMRRRKVFGFANDDCHNHFNAHRPGDVAVAWNMVKAKSLSAFDIMEAFRKGHFYSSWGPEIKDFRIDGDMVEVETSPAKEISIHANPGRGCGETFTAMKGSISSASYKMRGSETYFRIEVVDKFNKRAWSNPLWVEASR